jgi:hypothetical protein
VQLSLRPYATAGVALTGAGLIAIAPITQPPPAENLSRPVALTAGDPSDNAFTVDGLTFDPGAGGYNILTPLTGVAPLLQIGGDAAPFGTPSSSQDLAVFDDSGTGLGTIHNVVYSSDILGIDSVQFTVDGNAPLLADIESALTDSDIDFSNAGFTATDLAHDLVSANIYGDGDITPGLIQQAVGTGSIGFLPFLQSGINPAEVANVINTEVLPDFDPSDLPDDGTVYSITNFGSGFANVYEAVPNADGTAAAHISDTLVTPWGTLDIPTEYDAIANINPGTAFEGFAATSDNVSDHAFTLDGLTFDPGSDGFTSAPQLFGVAPLLELGGGAPIFGKDNSPEDVLLNFRELQNLEIYDDGSDLGQVMTGWNTQNLLGIDNTQLMVTSVAPKTDVIAGALADNGISFSSGADYDETDLANALVNGGLGGGLDFSGDDITHALKGTSIGSALGINAAGTFNPDHVADGITFTPDTAATALGGIGADALAGLPATHTVYSVTDLGSGFANVYVALPNSDGTAAASITDTLVTPWGSFNIPTDYDAVAPMDPGAAFTGLGDAGDLGSDNAFTIDGITFDPGSAGFNPVYPLAGNAPLLEIAGAGPIGDRILAYQDFDVYGDGSEPGSIEATLNTANLLGLIDSTQFSVYQYNVPTDVFAGALDDSDIDFSGAQFDAGDLVNALENGHAGASVALGSGDLTGDDVTQLLLSTGSGINLGAAGIDADDVAAVLNGAVADYGTDFGLPGVGTIYSVTDFGLGFSNVYIATPDADGDAAGDIQDFLVTPFGNVDLSSVFDAFALDPGDAAGGVDATGDPLFDAAAGSFDLFDPSTWF